MYKYSKDKFLEFTNYEKFQVIYNIFTYTVLPKININK